MPITLISGAASGLGRAFFQAYAADPNNHIIAIDRAPIHTSELQNVQATIETYEVDVTSKDSLNLFLLRHIEYKAVSLFIHCVGIRGLVPEVESKYPDSVTKAETLKVMDEETMAHTFNINVIGTFSLLKGVRDSLLLATMVTGKPGKAVIMGSRMGSMSANTSGSAYAYRASKAALNAVVKSFSIDEPDVIFTVLHPGRVETGLVMCKEEGAISALESVAEMLPLIEKLEKKDSGTFMDRFGDKIDW
jgi:NAD(P)-dependent dehydrogenase (short-subunit alcohol dehydrogenase family)